MVEVYKRSIETLIEKITPQEYQKNEDLYHLASFLQRLYQINEVENVLHFSKFYLKNLPKGGENLFEGRFRLIDFNSKIEREKDQKLIETTSGSTDNFLGDY